MQLTARSSPENALYNDQVELLDNMFEFHPDVFLQLSEDERKALGDYFSVGQEVPENIFEYRQHIIKERPELQAKAEQAFYKIVKLLGVQWNN